MASDFEDYLKDMFSPIDGVVFRRMFGGLGIFREKTMFGLVADDILYFRVDDEIVSDFEAEGSGPFVYDGKNKPIEMPYWRAPEHLFDDPEDFVAWAEKVLRGGIKGCKKEKPALRTGFVLKQSRKIRRPCRPACPLNHLPI